MKSNLLLLLRLQLLFQVGAHEDARAASWARVDARRNDPHPFWHSHRFTNRPCQMETALPTCLPREFFVVVYLHSFTRINFNVIKTPAHTLLSSTLLSTTFKSNCNVIKIWQNKILPCLQFLQVDFLDEFLVDVIFV